MIVGNLYIQQGVGVVESKRAFEQHWGIRKFKSVDSLQGLCRARLKFYQEGKSSVFKEVFRVGGRYELLWATVSACSVLKPALTCWAN